MKKLTEQKRLCSVMGFVFVVGDHAVGKFVVVKYIGSV